MGLYQSMRLTVIDIASVSPLLDSGIFTVTLRNGQIWRRIAYIA